MAKYRGKHEGKTRGKYARKAFLSNQKSPEENNEFYKRLVDLMDLKGFEVNPDYVANDEREWELNHDTGNITYHVAGATVGILRMENRNSESCWPSYLGKHATRLKLVTNDSLDDIIEMTLKEFPSFFEVDFDTL